MISVSDDVMVSILMYELSVAGSGYKPAMSQIHRSSDTVTVSFGNVRPVANAEKSLAAKVGDTVTLAGDGTDANGDALSYHWMLSSLPGGGLSEMADSSVRVTTFTPDRAGVYVAQLVVSDGDLDSKPCAIQIHTNEGHSGFAGIGKALIRPKQGCQIIWMVTWFNILGITR